MWTVRLPFRTKGDSDVSVSDGVTALFWERCASRGLVLRLHARVVRIVSAELGLPFKLEMTSWTEGTDTRSYGYLVVWAHHAPHDTNFESSCPISHFLSIVTREERCSGTGKGA